LHRLEHGLASGPAHATAQQMTIRGLVEREGGAAEAEPRAVGADHARR
jgi:hypothetical protein